MYIVQTLDRVSELSTGCPNLVTLPYYGNSQKQLVRWSMVKPCTDLVTALLYKLLLHRVLNVVIREFNFHEYDFAKFRVDL